MPSLSHHIVHIILNSLVSPRGSEVRAIPWASRICVRVLYLALTTELFAITPLKFINTKSQLYIKKWHKQTIYKYSGLVFTCLV